MDEILVVPAAGAPPSGWTLGQLMDRVRKVLRDDDDEFIGNAEIAYWLNEGQMEIARRTDLLRVEFTTFFDANGRVTLPDDFLRLLDLRSSLANRDGSYDVALVDDSAFFTWKDSASTPSQVIARMFGGYIQTYPVQPNTAQLTIAYVKRPQDMSGLDDYPEIPADYQVQLLRYAQAQGKLKEREMDAYQAYMQQFLEALPPPAPPIERLLPMPMSMSFEPNAFDLEPDSSHLGG
jgi:hypothetical protein